MDTQAQLGDHAQSMTINTQPLRTRPGSKAGDVDLHMPRSST